MRRKPGAHAPVEAPLRQGRIAPGPALDVLLPKRAFSFAQAICGGAVPHCSPAPAPPWARATSGSMKSVVPGWRSRQPRKSQKLLPARACGFESRPRHHPLSATADGCLTAPPRRRARGTCFPRISARCPETADGHAATAPQCRPSARKPPSVMSPSKTPNIPPRGSGRRHGRETYRLRVSPPQRQQMHP
jgi:hypothetical protein